MNSKIKLFLSVRPEGSGSTAYLKGQTISNFFLIRTDPSSTQHKAAPLRTNGKKTYLEKIFFYSLLALSTSIHSLILTSHSDFISKGITCLQQQNLDEAYTYFLQALAQSPTDPEQLRTIGNNLLLLGNTFYTNYQLEKAANVFEKLTALFPTSASVHFNLGFTLNELTRYHQAQDCFKKACVLKPDAADFQVALATALLATGDYETGWQLYEKRWELPDKKTMIMNAPQWDGIASLRNKTMLLLSEGALGDCIQFVRYAQVLKSHGATIILKTLKPLHLLLSNCPYIDSIIIDGATPTYDYYTSLMSLPALLHTSLRLSTSSDLATLRKSSGLKANSGVYPEQGEWDRQAIPTNIPYIFPDNELKKSWHNILNKDQHFNIGICWQADAANDANRPPLARRSIPAELFAPLADLPGIKLYSLQHGQTAPSFMHDFGPDLDKTNGRFMDTSAIISNLDLVISVDTSIAHLASALGTTTWVILPYKADWRWLHEGDAHSTTPTGHAQDDNEKNLLKNKIDYATQSPWYPGMKLVRKKQNESWHEVIEHIAQTLSKIDLHKKGINT